MNFNECINKLESGLCELHLPFNRKQIDLFTDYYRLLIEKNKVMNLTTITEFDAVIEKHFLDSLALVKAVPGLDDQKVLDLGTGAGFPGIPLKIIFPKLDMILLDSLNKRVQFLNDVIDQLHLPLVKAVHGRAEEMGRNSEYRQQFDYCVSRAVANLSSLSEYALPFVKTGGYFISYKSADVEQEVADADKAICLLGGKSDNIIKFFLPQSDIQRSLVIIKKEKNTPKTYPRRSGVPSKNPLK